VNCQTLPRHFSDYEDELGDLDGGGVACRLRTFLAGRTFEPEQIAVMSAAFTDTCRALSLDADNALMPLVAQHVMGLGQRGVKAALCCTCLRSKSLDHTGKSIAGAALWANLTLYGHSQ
jgi:hypothetical protein